MCCNQYNVLLPTVNWEFVDRHRGYMDAANRGFPPLEPGVVRLIPSLPSLGAASAARVYRVFPLGKDTIIYFF